MGCEPEQLELEIDLDSFEAFKRGLMGMPGRPGPLCRDWNEKGFNSSAHFLDAWKTINELTSTATWTKKLLLSLVRTDMGLRAAHLVRAFGMATTGDEVGALGLDIIQYALHQPSREVRLSAFIALEHWLEDDEEGTWLDVLNDHVDKESDRDLKRLFVEIVNEHLEELSTLAEEDDEEEDEFVGPELEEYLDVGRALENRARGQVVTSALPGFLKNVLEVPVPLTLSVLESLKIGKLVTLEDPQYGFLLSPTSGGWQLRAWRLDGTHSFSVEPTASDGNWLLFVRF